MSLDQINQNPYFGCFEIFSLFLDINFIFHYRLESIIVKPDKNSIFLKNGKALISVRN